MKRSVFNKVMMILIFLALVANLVMYTSGTKETMAQEARRVTPEYAIALSIQEVARALEKVASSNDNIAKSIDRLAQVKSLSN